MAGPNARWIVVVDRNAETARVEAHLLEAGPEQVRPMTAKFSAEFEAPDLAAAIAEFRRAWNKHLYRQARAK